MLIKRYLIPLTLLWPEILINKYQKALWIKIWIGHDLGYEIKKNFKKLQTFDLSYFIGGNQFNNGG